MADYTDLLRRAVEALPENNGAARRRVYEKARKALKDQLRAIDLPARDVTQHRLQLEDCIRAVEQQATEQIFGGLSKYETAAFDMADDQAVAEQDDAHVMADESVEVTTAENVSHAGDDHDEGETADLDDDTDSARDDVVSDNDVPTVDHLAKIIDADRDEAPKIALETTHEDDDAAIVVTDEKEGDDAGDRLISTPLKTPPANGSVSTEPTQDDVRKTMSSIGEVIMQAQAAQDHAAMSSSMSVSASSMRIAHSEAEPRVETFSKSVVGTVSDVKSGAEKAAAVAMSVVREVELDGDDDDGDPQRTIDKAIAKLDRAAKGESDDDSDVADAALDDAGLALSAANEQVVAASGGKSAVTIFLLVFLVLLALVGGAGYWAWREGYVNLEALLGREQTNVPPVSTTNDPANITLGTEAGGPGNTVATPVAVDTPVVTLGDKPSDVVSTQSPVTAIPPIVAAPNADDSKSEDRLPTAADPSANANDPSASTTPVVADVIENGSQSLLLEATDDGKTGAVPFSGTVEWTRGVDETGQPTLIAKANIPARNMQLALLIRKNSDDSLPASHLVEIDFTLSDSFIGGGIGRIAGVLLKNEELVQGTAMVGASARISGNSFLFAMSAAEQDRTTNNALLRDRKWLDLAMLYSTGKQAIITLEKDAAAQALFVEVMDIWAKTPPSP